MEKEIFKKEIAMCQELSKKNSGRCNWGECAKCGVVPLLYKLGTGKIYEDPSEIKNLRQGILK